MHTCPPRLVTNAVVSTCLGANPPCPGTGQKGGHTPSQNMCAHGSIPTMVQQCPQPIGDPHIVWKADDGPPIPSSILPPYRKPFHLLEQRIGKCYRVPQCRFAQGHVQKGEAMDAFAWAVSDVIKKGVVYYTNLPAGSGSPSSKCKARGGGQNS